MLVLGRKENETIVIEVPSENGGTPTRIEVTIVDVRGFSCRVGLDAPKQVRIRRGELLPRQAG